MSLKKGSNSKPTKKSSTLNAKKLLARPYLRLVSSR